MRRARFKRKRKIEGRGKGKGEREIGSEALAETEKIANVQWGLFTKWLQPWGIPLPRGPCGATSLLPHLAKLFFLGFLFLLRAKKPHTNENLPGSTPPSRHNADFCFHRAKTSDKGLRELLNLRLLATCDGRAESDASISEKRN